MNPQKQEPKLEDVRIIRILATDIPGNKNVYTGLTRIKGVSWSVANAICHFLKLDKNQKMAALSKERVEEITAYLKNLQLPNFLLNRRNDLETGAKAHILTSELDLKKEFDIKRLKKIKSYRGLRHSLGQPVRGQRTRSHFRKNKSVGVTKRAGKSK